MQSIKKLVKIISVFLLILFQANKSLLSAEMPAEAQVKAGFVYNFAKFTEWPSSAFATPQSPIHLCISRSKNNHYNAFTPLDGRVVQGHPLQVKMIMQLEEIKSCHVFYLSDVDEKYVSDALRLTGSLPILTIGDADNFIDMGGVIGLIAVNSGIQFEINLEATKRANLVLSAQLLKLAKNVVEAKGKHQ
jgi:hypothetical protein